MKELGHRRAMRNGNISKTDNRSGIVTRRKRLDYWIV